MIPIDKPIKLKVKVFQFWLMCQIMSLISKIERETIVCCLLYQTKQEISFLTILFIYLFVVILRPVFFFV